MPDDAGAWLDPPKISEKRSIYIRRCCEDLYADIKDLVTLGKRYVHISGSPGIGKSCFLWYVLKRLLSESEAAAVIVELVKGRPGNLTVRTFVFTTDGEYEEVISASASKYFNEPKVWLLTDQAFVGNRLLEGTTVLFASPKEDNWIQAEKTMFEQEFVALYMPPWSIEELQELFFKSYPRTTRYLLEFWTRYYVGGPIARYFFTPLDKVYSKIKVALTKIVAAGLVDATLFDGCIDEGQFSHKIFVFWPTLDFMKVAQITFASEWVADCFAIACHKGKLKDWMRSTLSLATEPQLRCAAGVLFERYAHHRLSPGGDFCCISDPGQGLHLEKREMVFFNGNELPLLGLCYLRPNSSTLPLIDSVYPPLVVFQISIANKRKPMKKKDYDALCSSMMEFSRNCPNVPSGLRGVEPDQVYAVLVKMEGDNSTLSTGLSLVEDDAEPAISGPEPATGGRRKRKTGATISRHKQVEEVKSRKKKTTLVPFQMTIALKMDDGDKSLEYTTLPEIQRLVASRMSDDGVDTGASQYGDISEEEADSCAKLLMRGGRGSIQYMEHEDGMFTFGVWMEAVRKSCSDNQMEETTVKIQCTSGELAGQELTVFVNERVGVEAELFPPVVLTVREGASGSKTSESGDCAYQFFWSGEHASVVITSMRRDSRKLLLVFEQE